MPRSHEPARDRDSERLGAEAMLGLAAREVPSGLCVLDVDGTLAAANAACTTLTELATGDRLIGAVAPSDRDILRCALDSLQFCIRGDDRHHRRAGAARPRDRGATPCPHRRRPADHRREFSADRLLAGRHDRSGQPVSRVRTRRYPRHAHGSVQPFRESEHRDRGAVVGHDDRHTAPRRRRPGDVRSKVRWRRSVVRIRPNSRRGEPAGGHRARPWAGDGSRRDRLSLPGDPPSRYQRAPGRRGSGALAPPDARTDRASSADRTSGGRWFDCGLHGLQGLVPMAADLVF